MHPARGNLWRSLIELQTELMGGSAARPLLDRFLALLLEHTRSAHGFLGEVLPGPGARERLRPLIGTPPSWLEELRELPAGEAEQRDSLLLLPLHSGGERVGLAGLAHRQGGDGAELISQVQPALTVGGNLLAGWRNEQRHLDITARKRSEEHLRALFRAIPDLLFRMRFDGTFIDWNDGSPEPTALPPEAFLGKKVQDLPLPRFFIEMTLTHVQRVIREGTLAIFEYELEKKDRGLQHYEARVVRSGPDEAVCMVRNITERKLVEERQAQLIRAEKLASLGQLAAGIAHEINNPVSYVTSNLNTLGEDVSRLVPLLRLLRELMEGRGGEGRALSVEELAGLRERWERVDAEDLLAELPEIIQESLTGIRRITKIVQSLRSFSHGDMDRPQTVDLNAELESTLRMVWNELKYKCEVIRDLEPLPPISCYPTQITQVFTNLLVNAAHAIERQGEIRIRTRLQGSEVSVAISDTGKGMTPETISRLFTPFFTTKPRGHGTGLGLSISRDIILRHGGRIEVQSEPGQGSTFTVYLPTQAAVRPGA